MPVKFKELLGYIEDHVKTTKKVVEDVNSRISKYRTLKGYSEILEALDSMLEETLRYVSSIKHTAEEREINFTVTMLEPDESMEFEDIEDEEWYVDVEEPEEEFEEELEEKSEE
jgi:hypothetical protein